VQERRTIAHIDNSTGQVDPPDETATGKARRTNRTIRSAKYTNIIDILLPHLSDPRDLGAARGEAASGSDPGGLSRGLPIAPSGSPPQLKPVPSALP
jgi:hypothetical protein